MKIIVKNMSEFNQNKAIKENLLYLALLRWENKLLLQKYTLFAEIVKVEALYGPDVPRVITLINAKLRCFYIFLVKFDDCEALHYPGTALRTETLFLMCDHS